MPASRRPLSICLPLSRTRPEPRPCARARSYAAAGGTIYAAHPEAYRTHADDTDPTVATFDGILTEEEIAHIIETALPKLRRAGVTTEKGTGGRQSAGRTNSLAWLPHDTTRTVHNVIAKIAAVVGIPPENAESLQVIRYEMGQRYNKHCDAYDPGNQRGRNACKDGGNRVVTALIYLTDVEKGGGTGFTNLRLEVRPKPGRLLIFHNCYEGTGSLHPDSVRRATQPASPLLASAAADRMGVTADANLPRGAAAAARRCTRVCQSRRGRSGRATCGSANARQHQVAQRSAGWPSRRSAKRRAGAMRSRLSWTSTSTATAEARAVRLARRRWRR